MSSSLKLSRVQRKGQVTIPQEIRVRLGLQEGDLISFTETELGFVITPQKIVPAETLDKQNPMMREAENEQTR